MGVGLVIVSHSAPLAEALADLAHAVGTAEVRIALAAGIDDPDHPLGTDAGAILAAIESVDGDDGVLVLMDLGSALLSAELARDLLGAGTRDRVVLSEAPLVEGLVAAAVQAAAGADLVRVAAEARSSLSAKTAHLAQEAAPDDADAAASCGTLGSRAGTPDDGAGPAAGASLRVVVTPAHGLHARPAARIVDALTPFDADISLRNVTTGSRPAAATSLNGLITLGARAGHEIEATASGPDAARAIAALAALAATNFGDLASGEEVTVGADAHDLGSAPLGEEECEGVLPGLGAAPGLAIGTVRRLSAAAGAGEGDRPVRRAGDPMEERARLEAALDRAAAGLVTTRQLLLARAGGDVAAIVDAHRMLLSDPALLDPALAAIADGATAEDAWDGAIRGILRDYRGLDDARLAERAADVESVAGEVREMLGTADGGDALPLAEDSADPAVLVGHDLTPSAAARMDPARVAAVVTVVGAPTSHAAILARALGIPAVFAAGPAVLDLRPGTTVIVDGDSGRVHVDPDAASLASAAQRVNGEVGDAARSRRSGQQAATTKYGTAVAVFANAGLPQDAARALAEGADGIGLLRSELLFLDRSSPPSEDEQVAVYGAVCRAMDGRPVVLRTLDIGGDKPVGYVDVPHEDNPFLGDRGIRLTLARPALLTAQLRAALRVAATHPLRLMLPMVAGVAEVRAARSLLDEARRSLEAAGTAVGEVELGVMVEVPALALGIRHVLPEVAFLSIGTNDLTQYVMAAERGNPAVAHLADALEPAVLRLIGEVCEAAAATSTPVAVCGGLAADPVAVPVLLGLGVRELSVPPPSVGVIKDRVRSVELGRAAELARQALAAADAGGVRALVQDDARGAVRATR